MAEDLSQQLQDQLGRLRQMQTQLQMVEQQRQQVELRLKEVEEALEELGKANEKTPIYKSVGNILIKAKGKKEVVEELNSTKESLELRKTTLMKQEGRLREKLAELQSKVENAMNLTSMGKVSG